MVEPEIWVLVQHIVCWANE